MRQTHCICTVTRIAICSLAFLGSMPITTSFAEDRSPRFTKTVDAIRRAEPAVVNIEGNKPATNSNGTRSDTQQVSGMGAGVIIDSRGYIITNQHVIQDVARIEVTMNTGRRFIGKLIARDPSSDLALVKIDAREPLPTIRRGTSSDLMLGEPVIAIGNPYGYHHSVSEGIISALHRDIPVNGVQDYPDLIQTDASINPGNSGGPLLNAEGYMIGINAAVRIGAQGIGFAIPADRAAEIAADMIAQYRRGRGSEAVSVRTVHQDGQTSLTIARSSNKSLHSGDVLVEVNGQQVIDRLDYELALLDKHTASDVELGVLSDDGSVQLVSVQMTSRSPARTQLASTSAGRNVSTSNKSGITDRAYNVLGMRLEIANAAYVRRVDSSYKGGLRVTQVRGNSPAHKAQIQPGDILVGLLEWQTPNWNDMDWILKQKDLQAGEVKFHIMRDRSVFWGKLNIAR